MQLCKRQYQYDVVKEHLYTSVQLFVYEGRWRWRSVLRVFYAVAINQCARPRPGRETDTASR